MELLRSKIETLLTPLNPFRITVPRRKFHHLHCQISMCKLLLYLKQRRKSTQVLQGRVIRHRRRSDQTRKLAAVEFLEIYSTYSTKRKATLIQHSSNSSQLQLTLSRDHFQLQLLSTQYQNRHCYPHLLARRLRYLKGHWKVLIPRDRRTESQSWYRQSKMKAGMSSPKVQVR